MDSDRWLQSPEAVAKRKSSMSFGNPISSDKPAAIKCNVQSSIQHLPTLDTSECTAEGLDPSGSKTPVLDICKQIATHTINNNISMNSNQHHTFHNIHITIFIAAIIHFQH